MTPTLLCLHGWGGSKDSFGPLRDALAGVHLEILTPDLPGFGTEPDPATPWTTDDYATWVKTWTAKNKKSSGPLWVLGHSHGGRTTIVLAAKNMLEIERLFLCAPAINRKHRYLLRRMIGGALAKTGKALLSIPGLSVLARPARTILYKLMRVHDYERASPLMQQTLVLVTRDDLSLLFAHVSQPTDIFWGELDTQTPVSDAHYLQTRIPRSTLHLYAETRHGVHKTNAKEIAAVIRQRLAESA